MPMHDSRNDKAQVVITSLGYVGFVGEKASVLLSLRLIASVDIPASYLSY